VVAVATLIPAVIAAALTAVLTRALIGIARRRSLLAMPNERSSHSVPTPTLGGIAIAVSVFAWAAYRFGADPICTVVIGSGGLLVALGLIDDLHDLSARARLPVQLVAVAFAVWLLPVPELLTIPPVTIETTCLIVAVELLVLLWFVNLYNFMDGIDGIAAAQCACYCGGVLVLSQPLAPVGELLWVLLGSALGFLYFNRAPARIFMGDVASGLLGLLVAVLALTLDADRQLPLIASLILLTGFWFDATYTLCVRIASGQRFAAAHRSHLYQKYARSLGHGRTTSMFICYVVVWLMPLAWVSMRMPRWSLVWLAVAVAPLFIACVRMRAGFPDPAGAAR
jgi:Fuc2NAc and GlcNAc transferase